jgi:hypothetical protein
LAVAEARWLSGEDKADHLHSHWLAWFEHLRGRFKTEGLALRCWSQAMTWHTPRGFAREMGLISTLADEIELAHTIGQRFVTIDEGLRTEDGPRLIYLTGKLPELTIDLHAQVAK